MEVVTDIQQITPEVAETYFETFVSEFKDFIPTFLFALLVFLIGFLFTKLILFFVGKGLNRSKLDKSAHKFIKSILQIVLYVLVIVISLSSLGANLSSIVAVIGAAGLAIGLALQSSLSNVAGGFIILFSKPFKNGDFIEIGGVSGTVQEISILSTSIVTVDNKVVRIPNGQLSSSTLINYNERNSRRLDIDFSIGYEDDYKKAITLIKEVISSNSKILKTPEPFVRMTGHAASSVIITSRVWVKPSDYFDVNSDMYEQVKDAFDNNGINIPYNQVVIHNAK